MRTYTLKVDKPTGRAGFLKDLNAEQRRVAEAGGGPILVIAGAGTGKTRALTYRTAHLVHQGVRPDHILLLTFTNKAAREMTERIAALVPEAAKRIWSGTFHAIANRILRQCAERLGYGQNYGILDPEEARDLMDLTVPATVSDTTARRFPKSRVLLSMLSSAVNTNRSLEQVVHDDYEQFFSQLECIDKVLTAYLTAKVEMNAMDYDDLLVNLHLLLTDHEDIRTGFSTRFEHVLVDEYQDTNQLQASVVDLLSGVHKNLTVVGDDSQSIYGFRGADVRNILAFPERHPGAAVHRLETNYRSSPQILAVANESIRHNTARFDKQLKPKAADGELPAFVVLSDAEQQAMFVAQRVLELRDEGVELDQQVVLYRAHYQAMELQIELQRRGIPFSIRSGPRFFEQAHIRDLLAHARLLQNPLDKLAWARVLRLQDGIGNKGALNLYDQLAADGDPWEALGRPPESITGPARVGGRGKRAFVKLRELLLSLGGPSMANNPAALFERVLDEGYEAHLSRTYPNAPQRIEDVRQLTHYAHTFSDCQSFLEDLALVESVAAEDVQGGGETDEKLLLSTVHQSKGLEWDAVFVLHAADGQFPLRRALSSEREEEEERRLFYVAVTRARRLLYLCFPQWGSDRQRRRVLQRPSRFAAELPHTRADLMETWRVSEST